MSLASMRLLKRLCGQGIRYDLVMLLIERLAQEFELYFLFIYFLVGRTQVPLQSDVTWADCEFARWQWKRERERETGRERENDRNEDRAKRREKKSGVYREAVSIDQSISEWDGRKFWKPFCSKETNEPQWYEFHMWMKSVAKKKKGVPLSFF